MTAPPEVIDAFTAAAITALKELVAVEAYPESPSGKHLDPPSRPCVCAEIELRRDKSADPPGSVALVVSSETAVQLAARYLPSNAVLSPEMIDDVAGEFANVIAGQSKTLLKGTPFHFQLTTPHVKRSISLACTNSTLLLQLGCELGPVILVVDLPPAQS